MYSCLIHSITCLIVSYDVYDNKSVDERLFKCAKKSAETK